MKSCKKRGGKEHGVCASNCISLNDTIMMNVALEEEVKNIDQTKVWQALKIVNI